MNNSGVPYIDAIYDYDSARAAAPSVAYRFVSAGYTADEARENVARVASKHTPSLAGFYSDQVYKEAADKLAKWASDVIDNAWHMSNKAAADA